MATNKYRAIPQTVDDIRFPSKAEANRYIFLKSMQKNGEIFGLKRQVHFPFVIGEKLVRSKGGRSLKYIADFSYSDKLGNMIFEDVKGMQTQLSKLKIAITEAIYGIEVRLVK